MAKQDLPGQMELPNIDQPASALRAVVGLITQAELAAALFLSEQTLASWRCNSQGPAYVKLGKGVFYRLDDVVAWVKANVTSVVTGGKPA